jgi:hypothetical protein
MMSKNVSPWFGKLVWSATVTAMLLGISSQAMAGPNDVLPIYPEKDNCSIKIDSRDGYDRFSRCDAKGEHCRELANGQWFLVMELQNQRFDLNYNGVIGTGVGAVDGVLGGLIFSIGFASSNSLGMLLGYGVGATVGAAGIKFGAKYLNDILSGTRGALTDESLEDRDHRQGHVCRKADWLESYLSGRFMKKGGTCLANLGPASVSTRNTVKAVSRTVVNSNERGSSSFNSAIAY